MNMNNYIIRTRAFSKLKIPYLEIISLSSNKKAKKEEKDVKLNKTQKNLNNNIVKNNTVNPNNPNNYNIKNKNINKNRNNKENLYGNIDKELQKLKSLVSNNITIISQKFGTPKNKKKLKLMKDDETNTEPILEEINERKVLSSYMNSNNNNINILQNINNKDESKSIKNKIISLKKKIKSNSNYLELIEQNANNNKNLNELIQKNFGNDSNLKNKNKRVLSSYSLEKANLNSEDNKINTNIILEKKNNNKNRNDNKKNIKKNKTNDNIISNSNSNLNTKNKGKSQSSNKINIEEKKNLSFNLKNNQNKKTNLKKRNIMTAINFSKSKDTLKENYLYKCTKNLLNNYIINNNKKIINKHNNKNLIKEELKINSLIKSEDIKKNKKKLILSNHLHNLKQKNIDFSPCRYNLFNVPVIDNNNSLEETIKQQTVSNFNNKYNFKFKTKNPKEKEKIKTLFNLLKKHDFKKYNSIKKKYKIYIDVNNYIKRPKTGNKKNIKIDDYFDIIFIKIFGRIS